MIATHTHTHTKHTCVCVCVSIMMRIQLYKYSGVNLIVRIIITLLVHRQLCSHFPSSTFCYVIKVFQEYLTHLALSWSNLHSCCFWVGVIFSSHCLAYKCYSAFTNNTTPCHDKLARLTDPHPAGVPLDRDVIPHLFVTFIQDSYKDCSASLLLLLLLCLLLLLSLLLLFL